ncbi:MspA family porin [Gordonia effusa]|nr:MspA family porin [Gordonia effusa]
MIAVNASKSRVFRVAPMGAPLLNHAGQMALDVRAGISNIRADQIVSAKLEVGYVVGYTANLAPSGAKVTANTPELKVNGGVNAKLNPTVNISSTGGGGSIGEVGGQAGVEATIVPSSTVEFDVEPGREKMVTVAEVSLTRPRAEITVTGIRISVTGAPGTTGAQAYARITVYTDTGSYVLTSYSSRTEI